MTGGSLGRKGRLLLLHAAVLLGLGALVWLYARGVLVCPVQLAFHLPCPTCGVTRALLALAQGDLAGYLHHQPMALFLAAAVALALHHKPLLRFRWVLWTYVGVVLVLNLVLYVFRLGNILLA